MSKIMNKNGNLKLRRSVIKALLTLFLLCVGLLIESDINGNLYIVKAEEINTEEYELEIVEENNSQNQNENKIEVPLIIGIVILSLLIIYLVWFFSKRKRIIILNNKARRYRESDIKSIKYIFLPHKLSEMKEELENTIVGKYL